jgi:F0F1-type ATP synthase epsilon subunit
MLNCTVTSAEHTERYSRLKSLAVPAFSGRLQMLPGHAESFILLTPGEIIMDSAQGVRTVVIDGGACHVKDDEVTVVL